MKVLTFLLIDNEWVAYDTCPTCGEHDSPIGKQCLMCWTSGDWN